MIPPLPDLDALAGETVWLTGRAGLDEEYLLLLRHAEDSLPRIRREAATVARPSLTPGSLRALTRTLARFCFYVLLGMAGGVRGRFRRTEQRSSGAVRRAQQLVRAGGPAYVKVGQSIATAKGLLPDEWTEAFAWCRDEVPPLPEGEAERVVEASLGAPISDLFREFQAIPRAAASIAQVHDAVLRDGTEVVVKVQRPGLGPRFRADLQAMAMLSAGLCRISARARMGNGREILPVAAELVLAELDFRLEALNMIHVATAVEHAGTHVVRVPRPVPGLIRTEVLVMERVPGVPYTQAREKFGTAIDGPALLHLAAAAVVEHALIYGVFHGDLHAGNVLITEEGGICLVDYGVCGRLDARQRALMVRLLIASLQQDSRAQIRAAADMGALPAGVDLEAAVVELDKYQPLVTEFTDAQFNALDLTLITGQIRNLIQSMLAFGFIVPKELAIFSRNLLYLNGFAAALAPEANMLAEIEALLAHMTGKYPGELMSILLSGSGPPPPDPHAHGPATAPSQP